MFKRLDAIVEKYLELEKMLSTQEVLNDYNKLKELSKEKSDLEETYLKYEEYKKIKSNLEEAELMKNDPDLGDMAQLEIDELKPKLEELHSELEILLVAKDENDGKNVIMEIRGAAGGDEVKRVLELFNKRRAYHVLGFFG